MLTTGLEKPRVQVTAEKIPDSLSALIHVRFLVLVDKPVVTVYLRMGCQQKSERRYVLLADLVLDVAASQPAVRHGNGIRRSSPFAGPTGYGNVIGFDFSDSHLTLSSRKKP